jgi:hypothetical protein
MRYLRYGLVGGLGLVFLLGGPAAFVYGLYHLMETGSCGSDAVYVTTRPCPDGTGGYVGMLVFGMFAVFLGPPIFAGRGTLTEGGKKKISIMVTGLWMWCALFIGGGLAALYSSLGPKAESEDGGGTGIFLAALFIPMGLIPLILALIAWRGGKYSTPEMAKKLAKAERESRGVYYPGTTPKQTAPARPPQPTPDAGDPVDRLRELADLRDAGVLTEGEFQMAKARVLANL